VINYRLAFLTKVQCPPTGLKPHTDILEEFPYIGMPHSKLALHETGIAGDHTENRTM
jgi:hypothetical protein